MTKRLLALFLVCILAIPIFAVPASATTYTIVNGDAGNLTGNVEMDNWYNIHNMTNLLGHILDAIVTITNTYLNYIKDYVIEIYELLYDWVTSWADTMSTLFDSLELMIDWQELQTTALNSILEWSEETWDALDVINTNFIKFAGVMETAHNNILDSLNAFWGNFIDYWEDIVANITAFKTSVSEGIEGLAQKLNVLIQGHPTDNSEANDMENQVATQATEYEENMEQIDEWTHPDYESQFDPSVDAITGGEDIDDYVTGLYTLCEYTTIFPIILFMAFSLAVVSFVVFGKVG